jgi:cytoskeleton protein RodZ
MALGSTITKARKLAGLSIEDLSAATNIRGSLLREIESDNFANCGGETYARGHIRNIAVVVGVDPQIFLTAFEEEQMPENRSMQDLLVENRIIKQPQEARKVSWKVLATISISSLLAVALVQIVVSNTTTTDIPKPLPSVSPKDTTSAQPSPSESPSEQATISTGTKVKLMVTATRAKSWLFVSDAAGQVLFSGQISRGTSRSFSTDISLNVKVGNAGGVDLTVNGKKVDPIGANGEVVSVSYGVDS